MNFSVDKKEVCIKFICHSVKFQLFYDLLGISKILLMIS